jgi:hypothetical protein
MRSSILARIPGFRQRIIPEPRVPSRGSQARGTRLSKSQQTAEVGHFLYFHCKLYLYPNIDIEPLAKFHRKKLISILNVKTEQSLIHFFYQEMVNIKHGLDQFIIWEIYNSKA